MKHNQRSASPGELACPHLRDHPTQEAKQQSNSDHGRSVVCSDHHPGPTFLTLNSAFCLFAVRPSFQEHTQNTVRHNRNTIKTQSRHSQKHNGNTIKPQHLDSRKRTSLLGNIFEAGLGSPNTINTVKTHSFFPEGPNVDSLSEVAQASCLPVQRLPASSTQPSTLNCEFPQPIHSRSACSAYPFEKILDPIQPLAVSLQTSFPPAETTAEILLRFAETSQQTLRHFSLLPITYINFPAKNALKSNLLRLLRLDPGVDSNFMARAVRTGDRAERLPSPCGPCGAHRGLGDGVRSLCLIEPVLQIKNHSIVNDKCPTTHFTTFQINKCNVQPLERTADSRYLQITKTPTYNFISHPDSAPRSLCRYVATSPCRSCLPQPSALALHLSRPPFGARTALSAGHIKSPKWQRCPAVGPQIP
jgi:hypothetical protein